MAKEEYKEAIGLRLVPWAGVGAKIPKKDVTAGITHLINSSLTQQQTLDKFSVSCHFRLTLDYPSISTGVSNFHSIVEIFGEEKIWVVKERRNPNGISSLTRMYWLTRMLSTFSPSLEWYDFFFFGSAMVSVFSLWWSEVKRRN